MVEKVVDGLYCNLFKNATAIVEHGKVDVYIHYEPLTDDIENDKNVHVIETIGVSYYVHNEAAHIFSASHAVAVEYPVLYSMLEEKKRHSPENVVLLLPKRTAVTDKDIGYDEALQKVVKAAFDKFKDIVQRVKKMNGNSTCISISPVSELQLNLSRDIRYYAHDGWNCLYAPFLADLYKYDYAYYKKLMESIDDIAVTKKFPITNDDDFLLK